MAKSFNSIIAVLRPAFLPLFFLNVVRQSRYHLGNNNPHTNCGIRDMITTVGDHEQTKPSVSASLKRGALWLFNYPMHVSYPTRPWKRFACEPCMAAKWA